MSFPTHHSSVQDGTPRKNSYRYRLIQRNTQSLKISVKYFLTKGLFLLKKGIQFFICSVRGREFVV
ncbi:hypothetical protein C7S17_6128 [Burkholderia thailandensis]|nr:hypothetical protein [Burkholderia thailandensis]